MNMIEIRALTKHFKDGATSKTILKDLHVDIPSGASVSITGESGSGKSTLLHLLAALEGYESGSIRVNQQDLHSLSSREADNYRKTKLGIVFQKFNLIDCLSVWDNICFPAKINNKFDVQYIEGLVKHLGLKEHRNKLPVNLSGGEQQRVAIARSLAHKPSLILADEPTGNLDDKTSQTVGKLLFGLCEELKTTLIVVTHSASIAQMANLSYHLNDGQLVAK